MEDKTKITYQEMTMEELYKRFLEISIFDFGGNDCCPESMRCREALIKLYRINNICKNLGIKKIKYHPVNISGNDMMEEELTLYIFPKYENTPYCSTIEYTDSYKNMSGFDNIKTASLYDANNFRDKAENIFMQYFEERNIITANLYISEKQLVDGNEKSWANYYIDTLKEGLMKLKPKQIDIKKILEEKCIKKFTVAINNTIKANERYIRDSQKDIENYESAIVNFCRKINIRKEELESNKKFKKNLRKIILGYLKDIRKLKFVKKVELSTEGINVVFDRIFIKVNVVNSIVDMGIYTLKITPNKLYITNDCPLIRANGDTYHSPHISGENGNNICFGNEKTLAYKLLGNNEYKKLVHFVWIYLNSYNPSDTYISMDYFVDERKKQKRVQKLKKEEKKDGN